MHKKMNFSLNLTEFNASKPLDIQFIQRKINKQNYEHFLEPKILCPNKSGQET
jgi:hypothetical protein